MDIFYKSSVRTFSLTRTFPEDTVVQRQTALQYEYIGILYDGYTYAIHLYTGSKPIQALYGMHSIATVRKKWYCFVRTKETWAHALGAPNLEFTRKPGVSDKNPRAKQIYSELMETSSFIKTLIFLRHFPMNTRILRITRTWKLQAFKKNSSLIGLGIPALVFLNCLKIRLQVLTRPEVF